MPLVAASHGAFLTQTFVGWSALGSEWILWLLLGLGSAAALLGLERAYLYVSTRINVTRLGRQLLAFLREGQLEQARAIVQGGRALEERVISDALCLYEEGSEAMEELVQASLIRERQRYERALGFLGGVGFNAPFIGLLGTLIGAILAFSELGHEARGDLAALGDGLSAALVTSAVGLVVGIPCLICFKWMQALSRRRLYNAHFLASLLMTEIKRNEARERQETRRFDRARDEDEDDDAYEIELPEPLPAGAE
jgi:biopolymer transport protein ExbB